MRIIIAGLCCSFSVIAGLASANHFLEGRALIGAIFLVIMVAMFFATCKFQGSENDSSLE